MCRSASAACSGSQDATILMSCDASRYGNAVASSAIRPTAPPKLKIGTVDSGEVIFEQCLMITSITGSVSGPSLWERQ